MEPGESFSADQPLSNSINAALVDKHKSPFENVADHELQVEVAQALRKVAEPYRTAIVLRDIEELSYDEIADITQVSLGTVKSRITRGREALRKKLAEYVKQVGPELGLDVADGDSSDDAGDQVLRGRRIEVTP